MNYITNQIFTDNRLNILADRLFYYLDQEFAFDEIKDKIVLSGICAAILQDAYEVQPVSSNLIFYCVSPEVYKFLLLEVGKILNPKICIKFKERILLDFDFVKIEIWFEEALIDVIDYEESGIYIHTYDKIPPILL